MHRLTTFFIPAPMTAKRYDEGAQRVNQETQVCSIRLHQSEALHDSAREVQALLLYA